MAKTRTVTGAGVIATAALVLIFGNQAYTEWAAKHANTGNAWGFLLHELAWPAWAWGGRSSQTLLAMDLRAALVVAFVAAILGLSAKSASGGSVFILGWASLIFASALAAFVTAFIFSNPTFVGALVAAGVASAYGLFVGWIVGIAVAATGKAS
jgi:hypothetical protein